MREPRYEYDNFKVDPPKVDDGWYLVKDGMTYRVDVPINKMRFTKSINILTGEVHYPSNADRIRSMSDEDLAEYLAPCACPPIRFNKNTGDIVCPVNKEPCESNCKHCWLDWLKEEAKDD